MEQVKSHESHWSQITSQVKFAGLCWWQESNHYTFAATTSQVKVIEQSELKVAKKSWFKSHGMGSAMVTMTRVIPPEGCGGP